MWGKSSRICDKSGPWGLVLTNHPMEGKGMSKPADLASGLKPGQALARALGFLQFEETDAGLARLFASLSVIPLTCLLLLGGIGCEWLTRGGQIPAFDTLPELLRTNLVDPFAYSTLVNKRLTSLAQDRTPWDPASDLGITGLAVSARGRSRHTAPFWEFMARVIPFSSQGDVQSLPIPFLLISLAALGMALLAAWIVLHTLSELLVSRTASGVATRLRLAVYHHSLRLGDPGVAGPDATALFGPQINAIQDSIRKGICVRARCVAGIISFGILALLIDGWLALAGLALLGIAWALAMFLRENSRSLASECDLKARQSVKLVKDSLAQTRLIKVLGMEAPQHLKVQTWLDKADFAYSSSNRTIAIGWALVALAVSAMASAWVFLAACEVHGQTVEAGLAGVQALSLAGLLLWIRGLGRIRRQAKGAGLAAIQIFEFLDRRGPVIQYGQAEQLGPLQEALEFDHVSLVEGDNLLLEQISLTIPAYHKIAVVGIDAKQKEALLLLVARLIAPLSGEIRWDRANLRLAELSGLRRQIGWVGTENQLFHGTILENITAGDVAISQATAEEAAGLVRLDGFIRGLPKGYQTMVGPHGKFLPEHVHFQISLARAWIRQPSVWLVKEPSLETQSEMAKLLDDAMNRILVGKTVLICPTRLSTLASCNTVAVVDRARINAQGTHQELAENHSLYRHLLRSGF